MKLTPMLKARFCKNCGIPINIFEDNIFHNRIVLFDEVYGSIDKLHDFQLSISHFKNEQEYFEYYNSVKDKAINIIKDSDGYKRFIEDNAINKTK